MRSLKHSLHALKDLPDLKLDRQELKLEKHRLLAEINRRQELKSSSRLSARELLRLTALRFARKFLPRQQYVIALLLIIMVSTSTTIMAQAAAPGDMLWPVKLTFEKAELTLAVDAMQESRVHLRHVDNRLRELSVVLARPVSDQRRSKNISEVVRRLEKDITAANQSLKITKEERVSEPKVVIALAKDLSTKANEAVEALEANKQAFVAESRSGVVIDSLTGATLSTSTDALSAEGLPTEAASSTEPEPQGTVETQRVEIDLANVITEVQIVNEYVSYAALESMIELVERHAADNRWEATALLNKRINEQQKRLSLLQEALGLVNDDFILHRTEAQNLGKRATELLIQAQDLFELDNLSGSLKALNSAKSHISDMAGILQEVGSAGGLKKTIEVLRPLSSAKPINTLNIQTITDTATSTDE